MTQFPPDLKHGQRVSLNLQKFRTGICIDGVCIAMSMPRLWWSVNSRNDHLILILLPPTSIFNSGVSQQVNDNKILNILLHLPMGLGREIGLSLFC